MWRELVPGLVASQDNPELRTGHWRRSGGGWDLAFDRSAAVTSWLPAIPAALRTYDDARRARVLWCDLDPQKVGGDTTVVARHAREIRELVENAGGRVIEDVSERGGRHVIVPLATPAPAAEVYALGRALRRRFPSLDTRPLQDSPTSCIVPPGSIGKHGGRRRILLTSLPDALDAVRHRAAPDLIPRLRQVLSSPTADQVVDDPPLGKADRKAVARPGGPRKLDPIHLGVAERGIWPASRRTADGQSWTGSEARFSVLCAAAFRGWSLADVETRMARKEWTGLSKLYAKYGRHASAQLHRDWVKALHYVLSSPARISGSVSHSHTSGKPRTHGGKTVQTAGVSSREEYRFLRRLYATVEATAESEGLHHGQGGRSRWAVLRSLVVAAIRGGSRQVQIGVRGLTFEAGLLDHSTVAAVLRALRAEDDGWVRLVQQGRGDEADLYELRIPARFASTMDGQPLPVGKLAGVHPVFRVLGLAAWRVLETVEAGARTLAEIEAGAGVSRAQAYRCVNALRRVRLLRSGPRSGWRRTRRSLPSAARELAVPDLVATRLSLYRQQRTVWRALLAHEDERDREEDPADVQVDGPIWWPDLRQVTPPPGDADPPSLREVLALLTTVLGAEMVPTSR